MNICQMLFECIGWMIVGIDGGYTHVCELRIDNLSILEIDWERSRRSWMSFINTQSNSTHSGHGEDIEPSDFKPLTETWTLVHGKNQWSFTMMFCLMSRYICSRSSSSRCLLFAREHAHVVDGTFVSR